MWPSRVQTIIADVDPIPAVLPTCVKEMTSMTTLAQAVIARLMLNGC